MWRHDLHVADFAGLPIALWAAVVLVDEPRPPLHLSGALAVLLLLLSLSYQYQWLVAPAGLRPLRHPAPHRLAPGRPGHAGAVALYAVLTAAQPGPLPLSSVGDPTTWTGAVVAPSSGHPRPAARRPHAGPGAQRGRRPAPDLAADRRRLAGLPSPRPAGRPGRGLPAGAADAPAPGHRHGHRPRRPPGLPRPLDGGARATRWSPSEPGPPAPPPGRAPGASSPASPGPAPRPRSPWPWCAPP